MSDPTKPPEVRQVAALRLMKTTDGFIITEDDGTRQVYAHVTVESNDTQFPDTTRDQGWMTITGPTRVRGTRRDGSVVYYVT